MTDEERRKLLVSQLRDRDRGSAPANDYLCVDAADELERQPVAWQYRNEISKAIALGISDNKHPISIADDVLALLANPPRPDVSAEPRVTLDEIEAAMDRVLERRGFQTTPPDASAGLIRALERISKSNVYDMNTLHPDGCRYVAAEALKAYRAADRSGK